MTSFCVFFWKPYSISWKEAWSSTILAMPMHVVDFFYGGHRWFFIYGGKRFKLWKQTDTLVCMVSQDEDSSLHWEEQTVTFSMIQDQLVIIQSQWRSHTTQFRRAGEKGRVHG